MPGLKPRAKTLADLAQVARFYVERRPIALDDKASALLTDEARGWIGGFAETLTPVEWIPSKLEESARHFAETHGLKLGALAQPLRAALSGSTASPPIFEVMAVLGRSETLGRLEDVARARKVV
jgi:glutamyl-tRNA synthetase